MASPPFPGVFVEEAPAGRPAVQAQPTDLTAFIGRAQRGPLKPTRLRTLAEFEARYGAVDPRLPLGDAVADFFANGGREAVVLRLVHRPVVAGAGPGGAPLTLKDWQRAFKALATAGGFQLLALPPDAPGTDLDPAVFAAAATLARQQRALLLADAPGAALSAPLGALPAAWQLPIADARHAALYTPRLRRTPADGTPEDRSAVGAVAGVMARTDATKGVWKAPAGTEATLTNVTALAVELNNGDTDLLNPRAINAIVWPAGPRTPATRPRVWGARTCAGTDALNDDHRYVPVRRLASMIETSLLQGLQWAVFEPNGEPLWAALRSAVENFLIDLWRQGALLGVTPRKAFFVRCDRTTMSEVDIAAGRVLLMIGLAPLKPAEFIVLRLTLAAAAP